MSKEHHVIYVPGLRDQWTLNRNLVKLLPLFWRAQGVTPHVIAPHWEQGDKFAPKLKLITDKIDELVGQGHRVSLVGQSAGGSAALNAFCARRDIVNGVVDATGRLRTGVNVKPSLDDAAKISPAFKESVLLFEQQNEPTLSDSDRRKILTVRPFWDKTVPASTVPLRGARNLVSPIPEHTVGGVFIVSFYSPIILGFLKNLERN